MSKIRQYESEKKIKNERLRFLNDKSENLRDQIQQDRKSNERAAFSVESLKQEKSVAQKLFNEIEHKVNRLKEDYETQKSKTNRLQEEQETLRRIQKSRQDEVYQLTKSVEIKELQLSSLKQELEKTASDTREQNASLLEFDKKVSELQ